MRKVSHRVIKNTGWLYAKMGITMFISLWVTRLILLSLGASDFGIYTIVGGAISMLGFLNNSLSSASVRFMAYAEGQDDQKRKTVIFNMCLVLHLCIALLMVVVLAGAAFVFFGGVLSIPAERMDAAYIVYASMVVGVFFNICRVPYDAVINSHEKMKFYAIIGVLESLLKLAVAFACVYTSKDKLVVYGILMAIIPVLTFVVTCVYCHKHYSECVFRPLKHWDKNALKEMLSFASWNFFTTMSSMLSGYGTGIVLNHFFGTLLNAAYGIASQLSGQLGAFSLNMLKAVIPTITKSEAGGQRAEMIRRSTLACKYSYLILAIFAIPFILEMDFILKLWLKEVPEWAVLFTQMSLVLSLISQLTIAYGTAIHAEGNISRYSTVISILHLSYIVLLILAFACGGSPVMLYVVSIGWKGIIGLFLMLYFMHRNCGMDYRVFTHLLLSPAIKVTLGTFLLGAIPQCFMEASLLRFLLTTLFSLSGYALSYWFLGTDTDEKALIKNIVNKVAC